MGRIKTALLSVADKDGLSEFARRLSKAGVRLLATEGTGRHLTQQGIPVTDISTITGKAEFLGGLVKTLHTGIHAGILAGSDNAMHLAELASHNWVKIDMVVVNFYPVKSGSDRCDLSPIDIGGPAMARAAAKNFASCLPVPHPSWYGRVLAEVEPSLDVSDALRWTLALDTLRRTGTYDARIISAVGPNQADQEVAATLLLAAEKAVDLRYGENPHQDAAFYSPLGDLSVDVMKGDLSYNNMLDIDCCLNQLAEFSRKAAVVVKHVGPCGVAEGDTGLAALEAAYACDPMSAFGGVIGVNFAFTEECALVLAKRFVECIVAPEFEQSALERLRKKKRTRLVAGRVGLQRSPVLRSVLGGILVQTYDDVLLTDNLRFVSGERPDEAVVNDLMFAWKVVKHVKSNAIVFAKSGRTIGIGAGQPSRVDAAKIAIQKAREAGHDLTASVMASDGFFPFPDCVELGAAAGVRAVVQPGGSMRDGEVIDRANALGIRMAVTSTRHFRH